MQFVESFEVILAMSFVLSPLISITESLLLLKIVAFPLHVKQVSYGDYLQLERGLLIVL